MKLGLSLILFFLAMPVAAQSKSYDGKFAKQILDKVQDYTSESCSADSCAVVLDQIRCSWSNDETPKDYECSYKAQSSEQKIKGAKAKALVAIMQKYGKIDSDSAGNRAMFSQAQRVSCQQNKEEKKQTLRYSCSITAAGSGRGPEPASTGETIKAAPEKSAPEKSPDVPLPPADSNDLLIPEGLDSKYSE